MKTLNSEPVMSPSDAAKTLSVCVTTVRNWLAEEKLKAYTVGGRIWIPETAVLDFIRPRTPNARVL
jgi:excisionase family DNA binding protein